MKIYKYVNINQEVELDLDSDDIYLILEETGCSRDLLHRLEKIAQFLKGVPDSLILQLKPEQKDIITDFFLKQAERFKEV